MPTFHAINLCCVLLQGILSGELGDFCNDLSDIGNSMLGSTLRSQIAIAFSKLNHEYGRNDHGCEFGKIDGCPYTGCSHDQGQDDDPASNTSVRKKEIAADMVPLLSEVKNEDPKIEKPMSKNAKE